MGARPRRLSDREIEDLLRRDVVLHLATIDSAGFPHVTPLWFVWAGGSFLMTSLLGKPHVRRLRGNKRASVVVDVEGPELPSGERPNQQVRGVGLATVERDDDGRWTREITEKYVHGPGRSPMIRQRVHNERVLIRLTPQELIAIASI